MTTLHVTNYPPNPRGEASAAVISNPELGFDYHPTLIGLHVVFLLRSEVLTSLQEQSSAQGFFFLYDREGFLCITDSSEELEILLGAERENPGHPRKKLTGFSYQEHQAYTHGKKAKQSQAKRRPPAQTSAPDISDLADP